MVYGLCFSLGYFIFDSLMLLGVYLPSDGLKATYQMMLHHIFASLVLISAMFSGYNLLGAAILAMMCEVSSVFLSVQFMYNSGPVKKNTPFLVFN